MDPDERQRRNEAARKYREAHPDRVRLRTDAWAKANPEKQRQIVAKASVVFRDKLRAEGLAAYGPECQCCGEAEPLFLTFDHPNNDGKAERKNGVGQTYVMLARLRKQGWPAGALVVLCWNCNCGRHRNGGLCPHDEG